MAGLTDVRVRLDLHHFEVSIKRKFIDIDCLNLFKLLS